MRICDICGKKGARVRRVTKTYGRGRSVFLIEGIPIVSCSHCGEGYLTTETLREVERIRTPWRQLTTERKVPVARFPGAA